MTKIRKIEKTENRAKKKIAYEVTVIFFFLFDYVNVYIFFKAIQNF